MLKPSDKVFEKAKKLILEGQCVAFPTDSVYGLGANGFSNEAIGRIQRAKESGLDKMPVLLISPNYPVENLVEKIPLAAQKLMAAYWPGGLIIIFTRKNSLSSPAFAGSKTVGIRVPADPVALRLLSECDIPLAVPSANRFGQKPPTHADEVLAQLEGRIPLILDGGKCKEQEPSTIVDVSDGGVKVVRIGSVSEEAIMKTIMTFR